MLATIHNDNQRTDKLPGIIIALMIKLRIGAVVDKYLVVHFPVVEQHNDLLD